MKVKKLKKIVEEDKTKEMIHPLDSFREVHRWLQRAGFCDLLQPKNRWTKISYKIYRIFSLMIVLTYSSQHITYMVQAVQAREAQKVIMDSIIMTIPPINLFVKVLSMLLCNPRIQKLNKTMEDSLFAATNKKEEEFMIKNAKSTNRMARLLILFVAFVGIFWISSPFFSRMKDETARVTSYVPFQTDTWPMFTLSVFVETLVPGLWVAFGHISLDVIVATYFAQAVVQLKIIKYNLEHLGDSVDSDKQVRFVFKDLADKSVRERFIHCVKRYDMVAWFVSEVNSIFNIMMGSQFLLSSCGACVVIYQMTILVPGSPPFLFTFFLYLYLQAQVFLFCYYAGLVEDHSQFVANALYLSDWVSLSPGFRREAVIAMSRWIRPMSLKIFGIVPLSLSSFLSINRTAYTLYTMLKTTNNRNKS